MKRKAQLALELLAREFKQHQLFPQDDIRHALELAKACTIATGVYHCIWWRATVYFEDYMIGDAGGWWITSAEDF